MDNKSIKSGVSRNINKGDRLEEVKEEDVRGNEVSEENEEIKMKSPVELNPNHLEEEISEVNISMYDEEEYQEVQRKQRVLEEQGEAAENEYAEELEEYFNQLRNELNYLSDINDKENERAEHLALRLERLNEDIERAHTQIEEYKEENQSLQNLIKLELKKNSTLHTSLESAELIDRIYATIEYSDLTTLPQFSKFLSESSDQNLIESTSMLRGTGGNYLKRLGSTLYFLHLLKERYKTTKIPQEMLELKNNYIGNLRMNNDDYKSLESKVKVIYSHDSFLINIDNEGKKENYTFASLKREACEVFNVRHENRPFYHIVNDKFYVYCHRIRVWDIHFAALENNKANPGWAHMELLDKMSIFMDRNTNINKEIIAKSNLIAEQDVDKHKIKSNELTSEETFNSEIEEYVRLYRRFEAFKKFFKRDHEKAKMRHNHQEKLKALEADKMNALALNQINDDEETSPKQIEKRFEELMKQEKEKFEEDMFRYKRRPEPPIYLSLLDIYLFRLGKFWYLFMSIFFAVVVYFYQNDSGLLNIQDTYNISKFISNNIVYNSLYKNYLRNTQAFADQKFSKMITSRSDLLLWLDIMFNNLVMNSDLNKTDTPAGVDVYNNYFQRNNTFYEILGGIQFAIEASLPTSSKNNNTIFSLPPNITSAISYFDEFKVEYEQNHNKNFTGNYSELKPFQTFLCSDCIDYGYIIFNPNDNINYSGEFGNYQGGAYSFFVNNESMNRRQFDKFLSLLKETLLSTPEARFLLVSFNLVHVYFRTIIQMNFAFEFSTIGDLKASYTTGILDTQNNTNAYYKIFTIIHFIQMGLFSITIFMRIFTKCLVKRKVRTLSNFTICLDFMLLLFLVIMDLTQIQMNNFNNTGLESYMSQNFKNITMSQRARFLKLSSMMNENKAITQISGLIMFLLFIRILYFMTASPLIYYILVIAWRTAKAIFNVMVVLVIFILCFSLIFHVILGPTQKQFSNLSFTILISSVSIIGSLNTSNYGTLTWVQYLLIIIFLIIIKFILFTFIYAIIKETYDEVKLEYRSYKKRDHFKLVGETVFMYFKYLLIPISFYFMFKDLMKFRRVYAGVNLEKFIKEEELRRKFYYCFINFTFLAGLIYQKLQIEKRTVYLIHELKGKSK